MRACNAFLSEVFLNWICIVRRYILSWKLTIVLNIILCLPDSTKLTINHYYMCVYINAQILKYIEIFMSELFFLNRTDILFIWFCVDTFSIDTFLIANMDIILSNKAYEFLMLDSSETILGNIL